MVMVDIGGNVGKYTARLRSSFPLSTIHVFEPTDENRILAGKFSDDQNIKLNQKAVSDFTGSALLYSDKAGSGLGSLSKRNLEHFSIQFNEKEDISVIRFDDYWRNVMNECDIDFVKIDVEGHELSVLKSMGNAIPKINCIQFEFGGCNIDTRTFF